MVLLRTAWLCDDAYITFRTVDNFVHGYGPRWNISERVQSFTHPLWFLLLSLIYWFTREIYFSSLYLSLGLSLITAGLLVYVGRDRLLRTSVLLLGLLFSRAYVDYSSSGLENPLSHVLLAVFMLCYMRTAWTYRTLFCMSFLAGLGLLTRMDTLMIYGPCLISILVDKRDRYALTALTAGMMPLLVWLLFALVYYGFPFPNTAYAKLGAGIPASALAIQGLRYLQNSMVRDPITLFIIIAGVVAACCYGKRRFVVPSLGILLYLVYVVRIGGDFMSGRYLTLPLLLGTLLLLYLPFPKRPAHIAAFTILIVIAGLATPNPTILSGADYGIKHKQVLDPYLIADERAFYFRRTGLWREKAKHKGLGHPAAGLGRTYRARKERHVITRDTTGIFGYYAGSTTHIIDLYALSDPLLARLPMKYSPMWRVGHFWRKLPNGYEATLQSGVNQIEDPRLADYYEHLTIITQSPILSMNRLMTVLKFNRGYFDDLIDQERYRFPGLKRMDCMPLTDGDENILHGASETIEGGVGLHIAWNGVRHDQEIQFAVEGGPYYLLFYKDEDILAIAPRLTASVFDYKGFAPGTVTVGVPKRARRNGYNGIRIMPMERFETYMIHAVRFAPATNGR